jgi:integral membrane protein (TIGR01906 family)
VDARTPPRAVVGSAVAVATALVIFGASLLPFLSPAWFGFEQDRAGAASLTGFSEADVRTVTDAILGDLVLGRGDFDVSLRGAPVLTDAERSHMRDVRGVFAGFAALVIAALALLVAAALSARDPSARARLWSSIRRGAQGLAIGLGVAVVVSLVAFDAAFEIFHQLFFAQGNYSFDPRTSRLIQLLPDSFWSETTISVAGVAFAASLAIAWLAGRRLAATARPRIDVPLAVSEASR